MTSEPGIRFDYRPSRLPLYLASMGLGLVLLALSVADLPWFMRLSIAAVAVGLGFHRHRHAKDRQVRRVLWASEGTWCISLAAGHDVAIELDAFRTFGAQVVLNFRAGDVAGPTLWLAADNTDETTRRRLRMRLARVRPSGR